MREENYIDGLGFGAVMYKSPKKISDLIYQSGNRLVIIRKVYAYLDLSNELYEVLVCMCTGV